MDEKRIESGLEWADPRVLEALEDENSGFLSCYIAVTTRAIEAQQKAKEDIKCGSV